MTPFDAARCYAWARPIRRRTVLLYSSTCPQRLAVCLSVTFVYCVERSWLNRIFKFFSLSGNTPFWFLHSKPWQYSDGEPLTEAEIAIFDLALELMTGRVSRRRPWNGGKIHCTKRSRPFIVQTVTHPWILFMTSNVDGYVEENKTEFNSTHW